MAETTSPTPTPTPPPAPRMFLTSTNAAPKDLRMTGLSWRMMTCFATAFAVYRRSRAHQGHLRACDTATTEAAASSAAISSATSAINGLAGATEAPSTDAAALVSSEISGTAAIIPETGQLTPAGATLANGHTELPTFLCALSSSAFGSEGATDFPAAAGGLCGCCFGDDGARAPVIGQLVPAGASRENGHCCVGGGRADWVGEVDREGEEDCLDGAAGTIERDIAASAEMWVSGAAGMS
jgi:hypothetical protein